MGSQRVGHAWVTNTHIHTHKGHVWIFTSVSQFWLELSCGKQPVVGCHLRVPRNFQLQAFNNTNSPLEIVWSSWKSLSSSQMKKIKKYPLSSYLSHLQFFLILKFLLIMWIWNNTIELYNFNRQNIKILLSLCETEVSPSWPTDLEPAFFRTVLCLEKHKVGYTSDPKKPFHITS